jgi:hypothetical protein
MDLSSRSQEQLFDDGLWFDATPSVLISRAPVIGSIEYINWDEIKALVMAYEIGDDL